MTSVDPWMGNGDSMSTPSPLQSPMPAPGAPIPPLTSTARIANGTGEFNAAGALSGAPPLESGAKPVVNWAAVLADTVAAQRLGVDENKAGEDFDHVDKIWLH